MLTNEQRQELKSSLLEQKEQLSLQMNEEEQGKRSMSERESVGELSSYDNHPADMGTELYEREKDFALSEHANSELDKVEKALAAMEDGSYGICEVCGNDIEFGRLQAVPSTTFCVEHTPEKRLPDDRPVEEELLHPPADNSFGNRDRKSPVEDYEDSFQEAARYGTSETPSDFEGDYRNYGELYEKEAEHEEGFPEDYESYAASDMEGKNTKVYPSRGMKELEEYLDEEDLESNIGDIPYHRTDGYVDDKK